MGTVWERSALLNKVVHPWRMQWMGQIYVASFDQRTDRGCPGNLPTFRIHRQDSGNLATEHLDHGRTVGLILDQLRQRTGEPSRELTNSLEGRWIVHAAADLFRQ